MIATNARQSLILAAVLLLIASQPAGAQLGGLKKRVEKAVVGKEAKDPPIPGAARVSATIEWTIESVQKLDGGCGGEGSSSAAAVVECHLAEMTFSPPSSKARTNNGASTPGTLTDKEQGRVTLELEMDPDNLPGGIASRMAGGPIWQLGVADGKTLLSSDRVVAFAGSVSFDRHVRPIGKCVLGDAIGMEGRSWYDPVTLDASGRHEYSGDKIMLTIAFKGDTPVSFSFTRMAMSQGKPAGVNVAGKGSYACGGTFVVRDTSNIAGGGVSIGLGQEARTERTTSGYKLTARTESADSGNDNYLHRWTRHVVNNATLTWTAPPAPKQQFAEPSAMAPPPKFEAGKGSITFTQKGKQATWPLQSVADMAMGSTFMFTPDGGLPSEEKGVLALAVMNVMGQTMIGFNLAKGPAGDSAFEMEECTVQLKPSTGKAMSGTGECRKDGTIVKFTFTSSK